MKNASYLDAVVRWALALPEGGAAREAVEERFAGSPMAAVVECFGLDETERRLLELALAVERSVEAAVHVRAVGGELNVARARSLLGDERVDGRLAPGGRLALHALLVAGDGGPVSARSIVGLGVGLAARLDGAPRIEELGPGARRIGPVVDGTFWVESFPPSARGAELVKLELVATEPLLATVDGCSGREAIGMGVALARRLGRAVLLIDGAVTAAQPGAWAVIAAARRDADLDGDIVLLHHAAAVAGAWRAAAAPPPLHGQRTPLIVLTDGDRAPEVLLTDGLTARALILYAVAGNAVAVEPTKPAPAKDDAFEQIRLQASRDADRAMGIIRREPPRPSTPPPPPAPPSSSAAAATALPAAKSAPSPATEIKPVVVAEAGAPPAPATVAAAAPAPSGTEPAKPRRRSRKAIEHFGPGDDDPPAPAAPPPSLSTGPIAAVFAELAAAGGESTAPPVELSADPSPEEMARAATSSPNAAQRIELMGRLAGHKSSGVIAALRTNAKSGNPAVRAAAEAVMAQMFGEKWNSARAVPKPVQPPRSDDKDRGPPGGY